MYFSLCASTQIKLPILYLNPLTESFNTVAEKPSAAAEKKPLRNDSKLLKLLKSQNVLLPVKYIVWFFRPALSSGRGFCLTKA